MSIWFVLARPKNVAHFEQILDCPLAHGLCLDEMIDLTVFADLGHLGRRCLKQGQRSKILILHFVHRTWDGKRLRLSRGCLKCLVEGPRLFGKPREVVMFVA